MSHVFPRVWNRTLPTAVHAEGAWIEDADGKRYLDGSGGAIVVGLGHGDHELIAAAEAQLHRTQYVHGTMFTTEALEAYADAIAPYLPVDDGRIYPVTLLPRSLYFLANDSAGLVQVFHLDKDGKTRKQVTSEPVSVGNYGVSPVDGSVAYVVNNQLVLVSADGSNRRLLVDWGSGGRKQCLREQHS